MSPGATFERVYRALKAQLGSGRFGSGEHLEPANLASDLNSSVTPIRDALHRLVGEGLVEAPRSDGFRTPLITEVGLRHLYRWHEALVVLAARSAPPVAGTAPSDASDADAQEELFTALAASSANPEHLEAVLRLGQRLRPMRLIEGTLIEDNGIELARLHIVWSQRDARSLRRLLGSFHRRRERLAPEIVARLHALR